MINIPKGMLEIKDIDSMMPQGSDKLLA